MTEEKEEYAADKAAENLFCGGFCADADHGADYAALYQRCGGG